jgi:hypothetical protein
MGISPTGRMNPGRERRAEKSGICVYCGQSDNHITVDHIPPKNLFPDPKPSNLITVPCCLQCNQKVAKDDEYFRTVITMREDIAKHPEAVRVLPTVQKGLQRPQARGFRKAFLAALRKAEIQTTGGLYLGNTTVLAVNSMRLERVASRIIQGLFYHEKAKHLPEQYEAVAYAPSRWVFRRNEEVNNQLVELATCTRSQPLKSIGDGVFSYKFCVCDEDDNSIVWGGLVNKCVNGIRRRPPGG